MTPREFYGLKYDMKNFLPPLQAKLDKENAEVLVGCNGVFFEAGHVHPYDLEHDINHLEKMFVERLMVEPEWMITYAYNVAAGSTSYAYEGVMVNVGETTEVPYLANGSCMFYELSNLPFMSRHSGTFIDSAKWRSFINPARKV